jgi:two-component sensor histidine kinase
MESVSKAGLLCESVRMNRAGQDAGAVMQETNAPELVMRELQHRMANTLTLLQASCRLAFAQIADPELRENLRRHEVQLLRMAELHRFLSRGAGCSEVEARDYFQPLCGVLSSSILAPLGIGCEVCVGEGAIAGGACKRLGLIVAELVTNAAKHGFAGRAQGLVRVELFAQNGTTWCCTVADDGCGMSHARKGTGSQILDYLVRMIDGRIAIQTGAAGTTVVVQFPARIQNSKFFQKAAPHS